MSKFVIRDIEDVTEFWLERDESGRIALKAANRHIPAQTVLLIWPEIGKIYLVSGFHPNLGFDIDENGKIKLGE